MKKTITYLFIGSIGLFNSCSNSSTTQIAENTFVYKSKVFKLVDNELTEVANLDAKEIRNVAGLKPTKKDFGSADLSYIKKDAAAQLDGLYRGNTLYLKLRLVGLNDLKENYELGAFIINFRDEFGFILHTIEIPTNELTGQVNENNVIGLFEYNGKTEISSEIVNAIKDFSVSSTVKAKSRSSYTGW